MALFLILRRESGMADLDEGGNPLVSFAKSRNGGEYDPSKFMSVKEVRKHKNYMQNKYKNNAK
jgi:hypothetical protein